MLKAINELITIQEINFELVKVKAHSGIELNDVADHLAGKGHTRPICIPNLQSLSLINAVGCWKNEVIEEPLRGFTKKLCSAKHSTSWRLLNRNLIAISEYKSQRVCWESTWRTTIIPTPDRLYTSNNDTKIRAFNIKLLNNELPTLEKLKDRFPSVYSNATCVRCNSSLENQLHVFTCPENSVDINMCKHSFINTLVNKTTNIAKNKTGGNLQVKFGELIELELPLNISTRNLNEFSFVDLVLGLLPISLIDKVHSIVNETNVAKQIIDESVALFKTFIYKNIWVPRCSAVRSWEKSVGIKNNKQKKKMLVAPVAGVQVSDLHNNSNNNYIKLTNRDNKLRLVSIINRHIRSVIKFGLNWVNLYNIGCSAGP